MLQEEERAFWGTLPQLMGVGLAVLAGVLAISADQTEKVPWLAWALSPLLPLFLVMYWSRESALGGLRRRYMDAIERTLQPSGVCTEPDWNGLRWRAPSYALGTHMFGGAPGAPWPAQFGFFSLSLIGVGIAVGIMLLLVARAEIDWTGNLLFGGIYGALLVGACYLATSTWTAASEAVGLATGHPPGEENAGSMRLAESAHRHERPAGE